LAFAAIIVLCESNRHNNLKLLKNKLAIVLCESNRHNNLKLLKNKTDALTSQFVFVCFCLQSKWAGLVGGQPTSTTPTGSNLKGKLSK
jgi:hypothetical protein